MRRFITFIASLIVILALFRFYTHFKSTAAPIPPGVYLGGLDLSDLKDPAEIRLHLEGVYDETIAVDFADQELPLRPQDIDFQLDVPAMIAEAEQALAGPAFIDIAVRAALGFPQQRREIPLHFAFSRDKLRIWLANVATEYNQEPVRARAVPQLTSNTGLTTTVGLTLTAASSQRQWRWSAGLPGYTLDIENSIPPIIAALSRPQDRAAKLILLETPPPLPGLSDLTQVLSDTLATFPGFAAVYVNDLARGEEANVDGEVAFSGMATIKLALVAASFAQLNIDEPTVVQAIQRTLAADDNSAANQLLAQLGQGDQSAGAQQVTAFARTLGLPNTYLQGGFAETPLPPVTTPANQRTDWNTKPDPNLQTTPVDLGRLLAALYACTEHKGVLVQLTPARFTAKRCQQLLAYVAQDQAQDLLWLGLPASTQRSIIHQEGVADQAQGDVALIWGPAGPYVLAVFLYQGGWLDRQVSRTTMQQLSRLTWDFFALRKNQSGRSAIAPPPWFAQPGANATPVEQR